jgi:hypothetical protein
MLRIMKSFVSVSSPITLALLLVIPPHSGAQPRSPAQQHCPDTVDTNGTYVNASYGFSIVIPAGLKGTWNSARCVAGNDGCVCMSDHGRIIPLSEGQNDTDHWIEAYAGFAADLDEPTLQDEVDKRLDWVRERSVAGSVSVLRRSDIRIGGIDAKRVVVRYRDKESNRSMVEDFVEALRGSAGEVEYSVYLRSPVDTYERDKPNFDQVLSSFALTHCDHC